MSSEIRNWRFAPDIQAHIQLYAAEGSARAGPIFGDFFSCPLARDGLLFDCRLILNAATLQLGGKYDADIKFLNWDRARMHFPLGAQFDVLQGADTIGSGRVLRLY